MQFRRIWSHRGGVEESGRATVLHSRGARVTGVMWWGADLKGGERGAGSFGEMRLLWRARLEFAGAMEVRPGDREDRRILPWTQERLCTLFMRGGGIMWRGFFLVGDRRMVGFVRLGFDVHV